MQTLVCKAGYYTRIIKDAVTDMRTECSAGPCEDASVGPCEMPLLNLVKMLLLDLMKMTLLNPVKMPLKYALGPGVSLMYVVVEM